MLGLGRRDIMRGLGPDPVVGAPKDCDGPGDWVTAEELTAEPEGPDPDLPNLRGQSRNKWPVFRQKKHAREGLGPVPAAVQLVERP